MASKNLMKMVPKRNDSIEWDKKEGFVVLKIKRNGGIDKLMHRLFKSPLEITVDFEEIGSFVWEQCDGEKSVYDISLNLRDRFGQRVEPVEGRLFQYMRALVNNNFIMLEQGGE